MKKKLLILIVVFLPLSIFSQTPNWSWANSAGGNNYDVGNAIAKDASGNIYVTGKFLSSTISFGSTILINNGGSDIFIVKYSPSGSIIWAKNFGGVGDDESTCISIDADDNIFIGGWFFSTSISFGSYTLNEAVSNISTDLFIAKLDSSGNVVWAKSAGGTWEDVIMGITTDVLGNVYVTGSFNSQVISFGNVVLTSGGPGHKVFCIIKYDAFGNAQWGKKAGGISEDEGSGITSDAAGNVIATGYFHSPSIIFGSTTLNNFGFYNGFIVKYDNSGNVMWAKSVGGTGDDKAFKVCSDTNSNIYITGEFSSPNGVFGNTTLTNASNTGNTGDVFVVKYDSSGNAIWAKRAGDTSNDYGMNLNSDLNGNLFVIGWFTSSTINFDSTTLVRSGPDDVFIVKYDALGNAIWAKGFGCNDYVDGNDILITNQEEIYLTGAFYCDTIYLGSNALTNASSNYRSDILTAKLNSTVGLNEINYNRKIIIYPNPFALQTSINFGEEQKNTEIKIMDLLGKEIKTINFSGQQITLEKGTMQAGVYFLQATNKKKIILNKRIVIQ
jgi:hypothetical protein